MAFSLVCAAATAAILSADVNVVSVDAELVDSQFACTAAINNQNDDDSTGTKVIVLLPLQVKFDSASVTGGSGKCTASPPDSGCNRYVTCELGPPVSGARGAAHRQGTDVKVDCGRISECLQRIHLRFARRHRKAQQL